MTKSVNESGSVDGSVGVQAGDEANAQPNAQADYRALIASLPTTLRAMHSALIQSLKLRREIESKKELTRLEWFHLLSAGPEYRWMHPLTATMSDLDALLDNRSVVTADDFLALLDSLQNLFDSQRSRDDFKDRYFDALAADPELILPQSTLKRALEELLERKQGVHLSPSKASPDEIRRSWHISERRLNHMREHAKPLVTPLVTPLAAPQAKNEKKS